MLFDLDKDYDIRLALDLRITNGFAMTIISDQQKVVDHNLSECFNAYILKARTKPLIDMLEEIRTSVMQRIALKREKMLSWTDELCPRIKKTLEQNKLDSRGSIPTPGGQNRPKKVRKKNKSEKDRNPKKGGTVKCTICGGYEHNKRTCPNKGQQQASSSRAQVQKKRVRPRKDTTIPPQKISSAELEKLVS
ncbi:hypothetical protein Cni_G25620 [Canna indica]|uniref:Uncharacterized protein n=1 Tax=Canna indica TaxID=4628 RepID=A0AAQ3L4N2_9LILI|nr:hypothetical protein Cni_G25620 [Canna indica]